ncbi:MAG TPA: hypothetical protein VGF48_20865 [Thermoanaerobaculia bacterium]|jgi:hypothetical protein
MKRIIAALLLLTAFSASAASPRATGLPEADVRALVALADLTDVYWTNKDAAALTSIYTADGHNRILGMPVDLRGQKEILAFFTRSFSAPRAAGLRHRTVVHEVQQIAPGIAAVDGSVYLESVEGEKVTLVRKFSMNVVVVKEGGAWKVRLNRVRVEPA